MIRAFLTVLIRELKQIVEAIRSDEAPRYSSRAHARSRLIGEGAGQVRPWIVTLKSGEKFEVQAVNWLDATHQVVYGLPSGRTVHPATGRPLHPIKVHPRNIRRARPKDVPSALSGPSVRGPAQSRPSQRDGVN